MGFKTERAAVIGAGVMGSTIAAHLANAGIRTLLLDIVPPESSGLKGDPASRVYRNAFADKGLKTALKASPKAFYEKSSGRLVETGNLDDDLGRLSECDWIIEVVIEKLDIKKNLFGKIAPFINEKAILSSNTSGLSLNDMAEGLDASLRTRFLGTHFFNPPRYMRLLEIIPSGYTDAAVVDHISQIGEDLLGKGIVYAKDTPNFIANRIGVFSMMSVIRAMLEGGYTVEEVDTLTGPVIGRPRSASFRTADLVGLDTFMHVAKNVFDRAEDDECREFFDPPPFIAKMVEKGFLGQKSGQGFYKKIKSDGGREILTLDYEKLDYRPRQKASFPSLEMARSIEDSAQRIKAIIKGRDRAADFSWKTISETLIYAANRVGEIADDIVNIDNAMKWGFNWELGPFELWDALGVKKTIERMQKDGAKIPEMAAAVLSSGRESFYYRDKDLKKYFFAAAGRHEEIKEPKDAVDLDILKLKGREVKKNAGASLVDMGDGVLCLEFHSKMNAIGADTISMINTAVAETEKNFEAMIIGNHSKNFSVGANLMLLLLESQDANWEEIDLMVRSFQKANMALKYCKKPVVAAPAGMTLGGGCEVALGAGHVYAAAETYMGLVEVGVGLIPGGGGTKELLLRNLEGMPPLNEVDVFPYMRATFETIGMAKVAASAEEARSLKFLRISDGVSLNPDKVLFKAKAMAMGLAGQGYSPPDPTIEALVAGEGALAAIKVSLFNLQDGNQISEYDRYLGGELGRVLCGGGLPAGAKVTEQYMLDLEREVFLRLCGQRKTQERMQHMLKKGKPLRN